MIKTILSPLIMISLFFLNCELIQDNMEIVNPIINNIFNPDNNQIPDNTKGEGLCIYPTEVEHTADLRYQNFHIESAGIIDGPIVSYNEIVSYDTASHVIELAFSRDSLRSRLGGVSVYGKPFLITLDSEKIYGGWFWSSVSSVPCDWVVINIYPLSSDSLKANEIKISLGYPGENFFQGEDPRKNKNIIDRLIKDGKVK